MAKHEVFITESLHTLNSDFFLSASSTRGTPWAVLLSHISCDMNFFHNHFVNLRLNLI